MLGTSLVCTPTHRNDFKEVLISLYGFFRDFDTSVIMLSLVKGLEDNTFHLKFLFCVLRNSDVDEPIVTNCID